MWNQELDFRLEIACSLVKEIQIKNLLYYKPDQNIEALYTTHLCEL